MKTIIDITSSTAPYDNVTSITADSEDASFPVENLRDTFTTNLWKAASGTTATITLQVAKGSAVALLNTNATAITITAGSGESYSFETDWSFESGWSFSNDVVAVVPVSALTGSGGRIWAEYPEFTTPHVVTIALTAASVPSAGIVRAGVTKEFRDPAPNFEEGSIDYSIERELNNGADYFRKRNVVRTFDGLQMMETKANAWIFKHEIFDKVGPEPLAIRLVFSEAVTEDEFVIFAKRTEPPQIKYFTVANLIVNFGLREVI